METEMRNELALCRSNPFMKRIYESLRSAGRKIVFTTDMYLPEDFIRKLLVKNGYDGGERIFLSSAYGRSKADGGLFDEVKREMGETLTFAHVGDNPVSDVKMAESRGFKAFFYRNPNDLTEKYRCTDMSPIIGSGYRGVVNNRIHCGLITYSAAYEYGYIYGGFLPQDTAISYTDTAKRTVSTGYFSSQGTGRYSGRYTVFSTLRKGRNMYTGSDSRLQSFRPGT